VKPSAAESKHYRGVYLKIRRKLDRYPAHRQVVLGAHNSDLFDLIAAEGGEDSDEEAYEDELGSTSGSEADPDLFTMADSEEEEEESDEEPASGRATGNES
jgi:hypothetical protein